MKYYMLYDLLRRNKLNSNFLRTFLSPVTVTKLNKGENVTTDVIERMCYVFNCQPSELMEMDTDDYEKIENSDNEKIHKAREFFLDGRQD